MRNKWRNGTHGLTICAPFGPFPCILLLRHDLVTRLFVPWCCWWSWWNLHCIALMQCAEDKWDGRCKGKWYRSTLRVNLSLPEFIQAKWGINHRNNDLLWYYFSLGILARSIAIKEPRCVFIYCTNEEINIFISSPRVAFNLQIILRFIICI